MSYTIIWFAKHKPEEKQKIVHVSTTLLLGGLSAVFLLPILTFLAGYAYMAPEALQNRLEKQTLEVTGLEKKSVKLKEKQEKLIEKISSLQQEVLTEVNKRAAAEARVAIAETARITALERVGTLEEKVSDLQNQIGVFQDILQPSKETLPVQCYNTKVQETDNGLKYSLSLLKTDNKDKKNLTLNLQARVLLGENVVALEEAANIEGDSEKSITFRTTLTSSGILKGHFPQKGVRVLDVRGYTTDNKLQTHCWKVF